MAAHILVAGGTGFVGRALVAHLAARGDRVTVASRSPAKVALPAGARATGYDALPADAGAVVNLAGASILGRRWTKAWRRELAASRIDFTRDLVARLRAAGARPTAWVNASAVGLYGEAGDETVTEASPRRDPGFLGQLCQEWEAAAQTADALGARVALLRFGIVLARDGGALRAMAVPFKLGLGGPIGRGRQWTPWIHRHDAVRLIAWALDQPAATGAYNTTGPTPCTNLELSRALARALHRPCWLPVPKVALRIVLGQVGPYLAQSQKVVPARATAAGFGFEHATIESALQNVYAR